MPLVAAATDGDEVDVELELDTAPREVPVPADLAAALDRDPAARQRFDSLSYSRRQAHVLSVEGAKTDETPPAPHRQGGRCRSRTRVICRDCKEVPG
jgi:uncharacterized protein YdeI (YjbR/CyaY-like superfamily)